MHVSSTSQLAVETKENAAVPNVNFCKAQAAVKDSVSKLQTWLGCKAGGHGTGKV
jgi:hypothetical protein